MRYLGVAVAFAAALAAGACQRGGVDAERIAAAGESGEWLSYGRTYDEQRFSPLDAINAGNVGDLGLAWYADFETDRGQEATPIVVDGILYTTTSWSAVHAFDAATGEKIWSYDPQIDRAKGFDACCDVVNRGVAAWGGNIYVATLDGRLVALNGRNGRKVWEVQTTDQSKPYTITQAPRVVKGRVLIGNSGSEYGVRGYITAYDAKTGDKVWRFYTIPNPTGAADNEASDAAHRDVAHKTWPGEGWKETGGGGTVWDAISYDPALNLVYFGVGNGTPWNPAERSDGKADNLFLSSIVAVNADTGEYKWHYQVTPNDAWDYDADQQLVLADLPLEGGSRRVIMQASKNGFFYVLDAATGAFISAKAFAPGVTWASSIDPQTGRPVEAPGARYETAAFAGVPGPYGAHNWQPMAMHPGHGLIYIPVINTGFAYGDDPAYKYTPGAWNLAISAVLNALPDDKAQREAIKPLLNGMLVAWDPVKQEARWTVNSPWYWNGGVLATAGNLVFQGDAAGDLSAYSADEGERLWSFNAQDGIIAAPMTYAIDGEQYVAVMVGQGGSGPTSAAYFLPDRPTQKGRLMVFKLGANGALPAQVIQVAPPLDLEGVSSTGDAEAGFALYQGFCNVCHSANASGTYLPNLRRSPMILSEADFRGVVHEGKNASRGMAPFSRFLTTDQVEDVRAYILSQARLHP